MTRQALIYGAVMAGAVCFVGWVSGMGGAFLPNLSFSLAMGGLAILCYIGAVRLAARGKDDEA